MTQYAIDFLESNQHIRRLFLSGGGLRSFDHGAYQQIMITEFRPEHPLIMAGDSAAVVKLVLAVFDEYDRWKESGEPVTNKAPYEMKIPELKFV